MDHDDLHILGCDPFTCDSGSKTGEDAVGGGFGVVGFGAGMGRAVVLVFVGYEEELSCGVVCAGSAGGCDGEAVEYDAGERVSKLESGAFGVGQSIDYTQFVAFGRNKKQARNGADKEVGMPVIEQSASL